MEENLKQFQLPGNGLIKIAIYGPESTGKTTLSNQLADHFKTEWAPEFARDYLQKKWDSICDGVIHAEYLFTQKNIAINTGNGLN
jgi:deoxyadenosine/deoxycytidine kinase